MTYLIERKPHPLDHVWEVACEAFSDATTAEAQCMAVDTILALPARDIGDTLLKIDAAGLWGAIGPNGHSLSPILEEAQELINAGIGGDKSLPSILHTAAS